MLHGATQNAEDMFGYLDTVPDETGVVILAPKSRDTSWDAINSDFGTDVWFLNRALEKVFENVNVDPARIAIGGFSDGASYGLSLGLINGDLFTQLVAFSPGFLIKGPIHGRPRIFVSHGTDDHILPIDRCGRRISTDLKSKGYEVTFREFAGDHEIPKEIAREGLNFVTS
jgi:predicted esterase